MARPPRALEPAASPAHALGAELRRRRLQHGLSQAALGQLVQHSGALLCKVEKAERSPSPQLCESLDDVLDTGGVLASMRARLDTGGQHSDDHDLAVQSLRWVDDVGAAIGVARRMWSAESDRRAFLAATDWAPGALAVPLTSWASASWSRAAPVRLPVGGERRVGRGEVDALWVMCASFSAADHRLGGGYARSTVIHYLSAVVGPMLAGARFDAAVGRDLLAATARLCDLLAFMSFDSAEHGLAQRYFVQALRLAHASGDRALGGHILGDMAMQAHHLGRPGRAIALAEAGCRAGLAAESPSTAARCTVLAGRAHAQRGDRAAAARCRLDAEQRIDATRARPEPTWIGFFTPAQLAVESQYIAAELGDHREVKRIAATLETDTQEMQRRTVLSAATLADAHLHPDDVDVDRACAVLVDALPALPALTSVRARDRLEQLRRTLARHRGRTAVADFEHRYAQIVRAGGPA